MKRRYLGDGVYVDIDPLRGGIVLTTENGLIVTNRIWLEPEVIQALVEYIQEVTNAD